MNNKAQVWITDFIIGFLIFSIGLLLASKFIFNSMSQNDFSKIRTEAQSLSEYFLSEGIPTNWTNETVVKIGLTSNERLNKTKILQFYNMSYEDTKYYLSTSYDYIIFFERNNSVINITKCFYGSINIYGCEVNISELEYDNLVKTTRFVIYNHSLIEMVLYVWN